jgi:ectoine hydroxylase-related dioxygenase (phytanoyl-CoA dioxygenase family)
MGRNAARLINRRRLTTRPVGARYHGDRLARKDPEGADAGALPTSYHQDLCAHTWQDRVGAVMFWVALADAVPAQGTLRFVTGSHREGPLGTDPDRDLLEAYPGLLDSYELSPLLHYRAGDVTAHHCLTVHGAPVNATQASRWSFVVGYVASDVRFTGAPSLAGEVEVMGLQSGELFKEEQFPTV